jgi:hypothetical protein
MNIWDFVNDITLNKKDLMTNSESPNTTEKMYEPFLVNRALSYYPDCILSANEMNIQPFLEKKMQYDYLLHTIRPRKRFSKWIKKEKGEYFEFVQMFYKSSRKDTETILSLLTKDQCEYIKEQFVSKATK